jgi:hypothetical protein
MDAFDQQVAELLAGGVTPKRFQGRKACATPEQWAAKIAYQRQRLTCPEKASRNRASKWASHLWLTYALTHPQHEGMKTGQRGVCAVCQKSCRTRKNLCVDHDHTTGYVRGLLCLNCNASAGSADDSPEILRKLADYIEAGGTPAFDLVTFYQRAMETINERN